MSDVRPLSVRCTSALYHPLPNVRPPSVKCQVVMWCMPTRCQTSVCPWSDLRPPTVKHLSALCQTYVHPVSDKCLLSLRCTSNLCQTYIYPVSKRSTLCLSQLLFAWPAIVHSPEARSTSWWGRSSWRWTSGPARPPSPSSPSHVAATAACT